MPQSYIIQEEMMVTGRVRNLRQLGPFIHRLCYGKATYRLKRRSSRRREYSLPYLASVGVVLSHFSGRFQKISREVARTGEHPSRDG